MNISNSLNKQFELSKQMETWNKTDKLQVSKYVVSSKILFKIRCNNHQTAKENCFCGVNIGKDQNYIQCESCSQWTHQVCILKQTPLFSENEP